MIQFFMFFYRRRLTKTVTWPDLTGQSLITHLPATCYHRQRVKDTARGKVYHDNSAFIANALQPSTQNVC